MKCNYNGCSSKCKGDIDVDSCNVLRAYNQGAREFAEWLNNTEYVSNHDGFILPLRGYFTIDEVVAYWQKEKENE